MDDHLRLQDAADQLGISVRTARRWIKAGTLPAELRRGRYGPEYVVPIVAVHGLRAAHGLSTAARPSMADLYAAIERLRGEVRQLREDIQRLRDAPS